ncbi:MAG: acyl--CoA ligase [Chloroflexi bacterium]|nr:acyl--CoA ligase [Chloroflexota bacterium]
MNNQNKVIEVEKSFCSPGGYFELEEADVLGERMQVFKNRTQSLRALLEISSGFGEKEYIIFEDRRITYREHLKAVASIAKVLQEKYGVKKGDRVAILAANNPEWIITFWATISLGAIAVGLNGWWVADEILYGLKDCDPKVLVGDQKRLARLDGIDISIPIVNMETDFNQLYHYSSDAALSNEPIDEDDPACILYTSGTTGRPKGVVNTHRNIVALMGIQIFHGLRLMQIYGQQPAESPTNLVTNPLFHASGLYAGAIIVMATGIKSVWMSGRFDPVKAMKLIQDERITNWGPMGTVAYRFVNHPDVGKYDLSSVTSIGSGGAPMAKELQDRIREVFPNASDSAAIGYGLTECTALATMNFGDEFKQNPLSSGRPLPTVQIEIRDGSGEPVGKDVDGEIHIRSPLVMLEYWQNPEATAKTILEGRWLNTGDIGRIDENGHLIINSRARDLILRGSENIYPIEIELRIAAHSSVTEVAVVGVDHEELGQEVKAIVVPLPDMAVDIQELTNWVAETLAPFKVPTYWEVRDMPLPRNAVGKVMKHVLVGEEENTFTED